MNLEIFILSVDGVHCRVNEPRGQPSTGWFSHKSNGPGLVYELAIALNESKLVWMKGPFKPGENSDLQIFRKEDGLKAMIPVGKKAIGDRGYRGEQGKVSIRNPHDSAEVKAFKKRARARHETFNGRIKNFKVLEERFRHGVDKHQSVFEAVCVILQYEMENGHPLFDI